MFSKRRFKSEKSLLTFTFHCSLQQLLVLFFIRKTLYWAAKSLALLVNSLIMLFVESIAYWPKSCLAELNNFHKFFFCLETKHFRIQYCTLFDQYCTKCAIIILYCTFCAVLQYCTLCAVLIEKCAVPILHTKVGPDRVTYLFVQLKEFTTLKTVRQVRGKQ